MNKYWFKPKGYGYGAYPTTWEGWALTLGFIVYLLGISFLLKDGNVLDYFLYFVVGVIIFIVIAKKRTDGEWKWSWGNATAKYK